MNPTPAMPLLFIYLGAAVVWAILVGVCLVLRGICRTVPAPVLRPAPPPWGQPRPRCIHSRTWCGLDKFGYCNFCPDHQSAQSAQSADKSEPQEPQK